MSMATLHAARRHKNVMCTKLQYGHINVTCQIIINYSVDAYISRRFTYLLTYSILHLYGTVQRMMYLAA